MRQLPSSLLEPASVHVCVTDPTMSSNEDDMSSASSTPQNQMCLRSTLDKTVTNKSLLCLANGDQRKPPANNTEQTVIAGSNNGANQRRSQRRQRSVSTLGCLKMDKEVIVDKNLLAASNVDNKSTDQDSGTLRGAMKPTSAYQAQCLNEYQHLCQVAKSRCPDNESSAATTATNLEQCAQEVIAADLTQPTQDACQRPSRPNLGWRYMLRRRLYR